MPLFRRNSFTALMLVSFSFVLFAFVFQQTAFGITKTECEDISMGTCKQAAGANETLMGDCTGTGIASGDKCYTLNSDLCTTKVGTCGASTCVLPATEIEGGCSVSAPHCCKVITTATACTTAGGACVSTGDCPAEKPIQSGSCGGDKCCIPATASGASASIEFKNPLAFNTVEGVLGSILGTLQGIIVVLALVFIVIGAILYITSAGNEGRMTLAKGAITAAMIGLAIGIAAPSFLKEIYSILQADACKGITDPVQLATCQQTVASITGAGTLSLTQIAMNVLNFLLSIVGVLAIIMLVVGGIMYLTAAGNEDRIDTGKKIVTYAIIGIAVALAALVIVRQIASFFGP